MLPWDSVVGEDGPKLLWKGCTVALLRVSRAAHTRQALTDLVLDVSCHSGWQMIEAEKVGDSVPIGLLHRHRHRARGLGVRGMHIAGIENSTAVALKRSYRHYVGLNDAALPGQ